MLCYNYYRYDIDDDDDVNDDDDDDVNDDDDDDDHDDDDDTIYERVFHINGFVRACSR